MSLRDMLHIGQLLLQLFDNIKDSLGTLQKYLSAISQFHRLIAVDKHCIELVLQAFDLRGNCGLSQVEHFPALRKLLVLEIISSVSSWLMFIRTLLSQLFASLF